jgi:predicted transcriptional regulator
MSTNKSLNITSILRKANVNFNQAKDYLDFLLNNSLIETVNQKRGVFYSLTPKGKLLLTILTKIEEAMGIEEEPISRFLF